MDAILSWIVAKDLDFIMKSCDFLTTYYESMPRWNETYIALFNLCVMMIGYTIC